MKQFLEDTLNGLQSTPKRLSSRYFYDAAGDAIFQEIMAMPEYYLPGCEREIIQTKTAEIAATLGNNLPLEVVELGAGDGTKTACFLSELSRHAPLAGYFPLDISANILEENRQNIKGVLPNLAVNPVAGNYFETFPPQRRGSVKRLNLFLGSNIGNFTAQQTHQFFEWMKQNMQPGDALLVAFDLKKNPEIILAAYNDAAGITARFNLNLLARINRELGANFSINQFMHWPNYNPASGQAESYIISLKKQTVHFAGGQEIVFEANEPIHTEISKKYSLAEIEEISTNNGFNCRHFLDAKSYYTLSLFTING
jgi:dimethylhistidine N-methyltransferase